MNEFKAGDFTGGKMGEIFRTCCFQDLAIINHKQMGRIYMMPEDLVRTITLNLIFNKSTGGRFYPDFVNYIKDALRISAADFKAMKSHDQLRVVSSFCDDEFKNWLEALTAI